MSAALRFAGDAHTIACSFHVDPFRAAVALVGPGSHQRPGLFSPRGPEEQGPGWIADPRKRPDGISARSYNGRWYALDRVPREPGGRVQPPRRPRRSPRAAPSCATYPAHPRAW